MLRITMNTSAASAKKYYSEAYYQEGGDTLDYYAEKNEGAGRWGGMAAKKLGLIGAIDKNDFAALCDNLHPAHHTTLTGRQNQHRTVGYDFTFNASKSVSLAYALGSAEDKRAILTAFDAAIAETMAEIEQGMQTRVRNGGKNENRLTGNIAYGAFTHFTTRPIDGIADPHLHSHCFVFNATYDEVDNKWKAGQFRQVNQDAPYYEAVFHSLLADKLQRLGYGIQKNEHGFELAGVAQPLIDRFSRRTKEIETYAAEHGITDAKTKSAIGAKTREAKRVALTHEQQEIAWRNRLSADELASIQGLRRADGGGNASTANTTAAHAVNYALAHHLERKSVTSDKEILATAIKASIGSSTPNAVRHALAEEEGVITVEKDLRQLLTTKEALREEKQLIATAVNSKNKFRPLHSNYQPQNPLLNTQQRKAVHHALSSTDGITIISGKAGTGKTTLMQEVKRGIEAAGKQIYSFAPSSAASRGVQRSEGFANAETVARLIQDSSRHPEFNHQVIWVDEAGMLSNRDMNAILAIAERQGARIILSGDTKQHSSVTRGDALRILQEEAGIRPVTVDKIQRQTNAAYREAVSQLAAGRVEKCFATLDKLGAIKQIEEGGKRTRTIAEEYYHSAHANGGRTKNVLVVSPTHAEAEAVTQEIRQTLKTHGVLQGADHEYTTLKNLQFTEAQKGLAEHYSKGQWVAFHQHSKGIKAGSRLQVTEATEHTVTLADAAGNTVSLPLNETARFSVYEEKPIAFAVGDKIRITQNSKSLEGTHLFNGNTYQVQGFDEKGNIELTSGVTLGKEFGHLDYGYVSTSHSAQGKTSDKVIISQSSMSLRASSMEQFYVSVSRGREAVSIYTDNKDELAQAVSQSNARLSATELLRGQEQQKVQSPQVRPPLQSSIALPPKPITPTPTQYGLPPTPRTEQDYTR